MVAQAAAEVSQSGMDGNVPGDHLHEEPEGVQSSPLDSILPVSFRTVPVDCCSRPAGSGRAAWTSDCRTGNLKTFFDAGSDFWTGSGFGVGGACGGGTCHMRSNSSADSAHQRPSPEELHQGRRYLQSSLFHP